MTYKTRQEVLRAAADWMDVCDKAGVEALCKVWGEIEPLSERGFFEQHDYEFPIALLEGKEVWVGSELWCTNSNHWFKVKGLINDATGFEYVTPYAGRTCTSVKGGCSWNQPKPATVMVEMLVEDAEQLKNWFFQSPFQVRIQAACKKALEKL